LVPGHLEGTYLWHYLSYVCGGNDIAGKVSDGTTTFTHQGSTLTISSYGSPHTGSLNADASFSTSNENETIRGIFSTGGGRTDIRDGVVTTNCGHETFVATKQ
jgi:hypothetical protein